MVPIAISAIPVFELLLYQPGVIALGLQQVVMRPVLDASPLVQHQDHIGASDGAQLVGNDDLVHASTCNRCATFCSVTTSR